MPKLPRERRTYDQECGLAYALDVVGERWTLLIIRELLLHPRRYKELLDALPGIGTNMLADRLTLLTDAGVIEPQEPGRRIGGYALTPLGRRLHEPILGLARFGLTVAASQPRNPAAVTRPAWAALAIESMIDEARAPDLDEIYQFDVDGEVFHVVIQDGRATTHAGPAEAATMVAATDAQTFFDLGMQRLDPIEAVVSGAVRVTGSAAAVPRCLRLIGLAGPGTGAKSASLTDVAKARVAMASRAPRGSRAPAGAAKATAQPVAKVAKAPGKAAVKARAAKAAKTAEAGTSGPRGRARSAADH
jgi:DNA-binding HxlR family transcriptional regulator/putative sterol carrier protein